MKSSLRSQRISASSALKLLVNAENTEVRIYEATIDVNNFFRHTSS